MTEETEIKPLAVDFYKLDERKSALMAECKKSDVSEEVMKKPVDILANSVFDVVAIYGNFPDVISKALKQAVNPLFSPEDYYENVYIALRVSAIEEGEPCIIRYAEALYNIRRLFVRDAEFFKEHFPDRKDDKKFGSIVQKFATDHINAVCKEMSV